MRQLRLLVLILLTTTVYTAAAYAESEGPISGGGGGTVLLNRKPLVIDIFAYAQPDLTLKLVQKLYPETISTVKEDEFVKISKKLHSAALESDQTVVKWFGDTPAMKLNRIAGNASINSWKFIDLKSKSEVVHFRSAELPSNIDISLTAFYSRFRNTVYLDEMLIPKLDAANLNILFLHENLRRLQFNLGFNMSDQVLQKLTLFMLLCQPSDENKALSRFVINVNGSTESIGSLDRSFDSCRKNLNY